jgi:hypothetical protein
MGATCMRMGAAWLLGGRGRAILLREAAGAEDGDLLSVISLQMLRDEVARRRWMLTFFAHYEVDL